MLVPDVAHRVYGHQCDGACDRSPYEQTQENLLSDALAREALHLPGANLIAACSDGTNHEAGEGMLLGSALAGQAFTNSPVAAAHALAYPPGGHYHVPHGLSNALVLGPVLRFNAAAAAPLDAELADVLGLSGGGAVMERSDAMKQGRLFVNNPVEVYEDDALAFYRQAF